MRQLIENLRSFNSKERFFLIGHILGNTEFAPSEAFREIVEDKLGLKIADESFAAMDYHLDWLYASLCLTFNDGGESQIFANTDHIIKAQQEDIDFIIVFAEGDFCHVILIEAKGVTGWTNKQMNSKAMRFGEIFGSDGKKWPRVKPHFVLLSPRRSKYLDVSKWPNWMAVGDQLSWIELPVPTGLRKVTRCNSEGHKDKYGQHWRVNPRPGFARQNSVVKKPRNGKKRVNNYRGMLPFSEMLTKCRTEGDSILVGYDRGGATALRQSDPARIRGRQYKWDLTRDPIGHKNLKNWMRSNEFVKIVSENFPDLGR